MAKTIKLEKLTLEHDDRYGYGLCAKYIVDSDIETREMVYPFIKFCIPTDELPSISACDLVRRDVNIDGIHQEVAYYERVIERKTKEMTLEEIEQKLRHKVTIVNKGK